MNLWYLGLSRESLRKMPNGGRGAHSFLLHLCSGSNLLPGFIRVDIWPSPSSRTSIGHRAKATAGIPQVNARRPARNCTNFSKSFCRCIFDESPVRGASRRGERGGAIGRGVAGMGSHELPSFRPCNSGEILRAAIIHNKATCARLQ
jgi:hypothetical protein